MSHPARFSGMSSSMSGRTVRSRTVRRALRTSSSVPSTRTLPLSKITTRSQIFSASSSSWVAKMTVTPSSARRRMMSRMVERPLTSTPLVGSSRKMIRGCEARAKARDRRCFSPPDRRRHDVFWRSVNPTRSMSSWGLAY